MKNFTKENIFSAVIIITILAPVALFKLNAFPIRLWDESMFAVNSYEMLQRNEFIVPYFNGEMIMWNSKPPLMLWLQMASIKMFGFNELAVRLPSAVSVISCILMLFFFLKKHTNLIFAWITVLILITAQGFFSVHTGRTGDTDALLTLILTAANLLLIDTLIQNKISNKRIFLFFVLLSLAFLCKSFAALLFGVGYFIILVIKKKDQSKPVFLRSGFWLGTVFFLLIAVSFILFRNYLQKGYIDFVFSVDIGRVANEIEKHKEPFGYYIENLSSYNFRFWFFFSLLGVIFVFYKRMEDNIHSILFYSTILVISYLLVISVSVSKLPWYTMPIYPFLSILAAIPIYHLIQLLNFKKYALIGIIALFFIYPYDYVFGLSQSNPYTSYERINEAAERYIFYEMDQQKYIDSTYVLHSGFESAIKFYQYKLKEKNLTLFVTPKVSFPSNSIVIVARDGLKQELKTKYECTLIDTSYYACKYKVVKRY